MKARPPSRTRTATKAALTVAFVAALLGIGAHAVGYRANITSTEIGLPAVTASPDEVVRTYVAAYNAHDFDTAANLYPQSVPDNWLGRRRALGTFNDLSIQASKPDHSYGPGEHWDVRVTLTISDLTDSDFAYNNGPNGWTYYLDRSGPQHAWRIIDHGNG